MKTEETITPYLKKKHRDDKSGYITIRKTLNRKSTYHSLGISIPESHWDKHRCKVKSRVAGSEQLNERIEQEIEKLKKPRKRPAQERKTTPTEKPVINLDYIFIHHLDNLKRLNKHGTAGTVHSCYVHLSSFRGADNLRNVSVEIIDPNFVQGFEAFLVGKGLKINSVKKYVATFRSVYETGKVRGFISTLANPFIAFKANRKSTAPNTLSKMEVELIKNADLSGFPDLINVRRQFLFQLFAHGLRISDLMTLQWENYKLGELQFIQFKTKTHHTIILNKHSWRLIAEELPGGIDDILNLKINGTVDGTECAYTYDEWVELYKTYSKSRLPAILRDVDKEAIAKVETLRQELQEKSTVFSHLLNMKILEYARTNPKGFIFKILPEKDFKDFDFSRGIDLPISLYRLMSSKTAIYNKNLKELQQLVGIRTVLTSHIMRSTFATLMIDETEEDFFALSKLLGHKRVSTTQNYISSILRNREEAASDKFGNLFN